MTLSRRGCQYCLPAQAPRALLWQVRRGGTVCAGGFNEFTPSWSGWLYFPAALLVRSTITPFSRLITGRADQRGGA
jgi:hypothetical protein